MSGLGLKIRTPQMSHRQKQSEREQVELGKEIVAHTEDENLEYDPLDRLLLLAARHKREMEVDQILVSLLDSVFLMFHHLTLLFALVALSFILSALFRIIH